MYRKNSSGWVKHVDFILLDLLCIQLAFYFSYVADRAHSPDDTGR